MAFPQDKTVLAVTTPLAADAFLLTHFRATERMSALFHFELELVSHERDVDFKKILGKGVTVEMRLPDGKSRFFHGICSRFVQAGRAGKLTTYRAELQPWLWLLTKTRDHKIFQKKSVPDIVEAIFGDLGFSDHKKALSGTHAKRDYCVQYQESTFAFISRLLEEEGIFYFFTHEKGKHTLVLGDSPSAYVPCADLAKARVLGERSTSSDADTIVGCELEKEVVVEGFATTDYNFETPETSLLATAEGGSADGTYKKLKPYEYPGAYLTKSDGEGLAKLRIEEEEALGTVLSGQSYIRAFSAGHTFTLAEHESAAVNMDYVVRSVTHDHTGEGYGNTFDAVPKSVAFRPPRVTPKPVIAGTETAIVVGKSGEEIWTDKYGRIRIQFPWDRDGKKDENSTCWVRVAQAWAGQGWGALYLPRIGQEVVVSFVGGDPDRPIVTGSVYNATQTVPYALPDNQTKSTLLSRSSKKGSAGNEIRFEDKKDSEELYVHAQKDMTYKVEHDWKTDVKHDLELTVKNHRVVTIKEADDDLEVTKGNRKIEVKKGNETHDVKGTRGVTVTDVETHTNKADFTHKVTGNFTLQVDGDLVIKAKTVTIQSQMDTAIKAGMGMSLKASMDLKGEAGVGLALKGVQIDVQGSAMAKVKAPMLDLEGSMAQLKGDMVMVAGSLVKIG
jgi:type VI secretion system secreted protein VgrG